MATPSVSDDERRRRLVRRHHLGRTARDVEQTVEDLVVLHSSDPTSPHLSAWARVPEFTTADLDAAICDRRVLWRLHAMRRTLWVAPTAAAPVLEAAAGRKVATAERRRVRRWLAQSGDDDPRRALGLLERRILDALGNGPRTTRELAVDVAGFDRRVTLGSGRWAQHAPIGPRVLYLLAMELRIVRGAHAGTFRSSHYAWARTERWFDSVPDRLDVRAAQRLLCARYLLRFGPATEDDLRWWAGWTKGDTRRALADLGARSVVVAGSVAGGTQAWLHPDDPGAGAVRSPSARTSTLLPSLDPTAMGWRHRSFYLDDSLVTDLFDSNGNVGPTVWVDGRVVGGWFVDGRSRIRTVLLADVDAEARMLVDAEVELLDDWLEVAVTPRFPTPLERRGREA